MRPNEGTETPAHWLFVDTESLPDGSDPSGQIIRHKLRLGVAYFTRLQHGQRTREAWCRFTTAAQFWEFVFDHLSDHRPLWLVAHNLAFDWPLLDGFRLLERYGLDRWKVILGPPVTIMRGRPDGKSLNVVDSLNWLRAPLAQIGSWLGNPKWPMPAFTASDEDWFQYCEQDVRITADGVLYVAAMHRTHDLGVMGRTLAQGAMHAYRHKFMDLAPCLHDQQLVSDLERSAYYGGRVECRFVGEWTQPVYQLDVNSLYPSIMRDVALPVKLVGTYERPAVKWVRERLDVFDGVARVLLETPAETYPWREPRKALSGWSTAPQWVLPPAEACNGRTLYIKGLYPTTLAGEELRQALQRGHVLTVYRCALYERAILFRRYVDWWYAQRLACRAAGDGLGESLAKGYLNTLAGVWAKRCPRWIAAPDQIPPEPWERWACADLIEGKTRSFRAVGNVAQEEVPDDEGWDTFPAISACITAAARVRMRTLQAAVGPRGWLYEDTDSLMVTGPGLDALLLGGHAHQSRLGALRLEAEALGVTIRGVKDYTLCGRRVLKGARQDATWLDEHTCRQWEWRGLKYCFNRRGESVVTQQLRQLHFTRGYLKGQIGPDGWTQPYDVFLHPELDWKTQSGG